MDSKIFIGAVEIAALIGIGAREIKRYVEQYGMPAFQEISGGKWRARRSTLEIWAEEHEKKFIR